MLITEAKIGTNSISSLNEKNLLNKSPLIEEDEPVTKMSYIDFAENEKKIIFKKEKKKKLIFIGIIYFISYTFFYYYNLIATTDFYGNISMITEILYFSLFNRIIFGNKIYSHHLFSMILISLCILGLYILLLIFIRFNRSNYIINFRNNNIFYSL